LKELGNIFLSWRNGSGSRRHIVGILKRNKSEGTRFNYLLDGVEKARDEGFTPYTEFPDVDKTYTKNVLDIFGQRLFKIERTDAFEFLKFWEIEGIQKNDKYYLLAHTMGLTPTDNFEFLADYNPIKNLKFITDLAGISHRQLDKNSVKDGDLLRIHFESENKLDKKAVAVYKNELKIGYIKKIHNRVFEKKRGSNIKVTIRAREVNGYIKKIFVRVGFDEQYINS
jgi:hypothetical protein